SGGREAGHDQVHDNDHAEEAGDDRGGVSSGETAGHAHSSGAVKRASLLSPSAFASSPATTKENACSCVPGGATTLMRNEPVESAATVSTSSRAASSRGIASVHMTAPGRPSSAMRISRGRLCMLRSLTV